MPVSVSFEFRCAPGFRDREQVRIRLTTWCAHLVLLALVALASGCTKETQKSAALAKEHVLGLAQAAREDVRQIRTGLPEGAAQLMTILPAPDKGELDAPTAREALEKARNKVQDLRVAKSTFFALVSPAGIVIRNDQPQDRMVGKDLFSSFPALRTALTAGYVEARGSMPEAAEVRGRPDAQWVAAAPVGAPPSARALYVTGWSWSGYAYRLENAVRSSVRGASTDVQKVPLLYAYVVVGPDVYGAPISPDVNAKAIREQSLLGKLHGAEPISVELEITGRGFGLGAMRVPELGSDVAIVVLRSET
jgi:hypothetical protein